LASFPKLLGTIPFDFLHELDRWLEKHRDHWELEIKSRPERTVGFAPVPKRWVVERTLAWLGR
jgi:transposase